MFHCIKKQSGMDRRETERKREREKERERETEREKDNEENKEDRIFGIRRGQNT